MCLGLPRLLVNSGGILYSQTLVAQTCGSCGLRLTEDRKIQ